MIPVATWHDIEVSENQIVASQAVNEVRAF